MVNEQIRDKIRELADAVSENLEQRKVVYNAVYALCEESDKRGYISGLKRCDEINTETQKELQKLFKR